MARRKCRSRNCESLNKTRLNVSSIWILVLHLFWPSRQFWKLRQSEYQPYVMSYDPLKPQQGELSDPLYFDFISTNLNPGPKLCLHKCVCTDYMVHFTAVYFMKRVFRVWKAYESVYWERFEIYFLKSVWKRTKILLWLFGEIGVRQWRRHVKVVVLYSKKSIFTEGQGKSFAQALRNLWLLQRRSQTLR